MDLDEESFLKTNDSLYSLVQILEELLLSIPLPSEILRKYICMRERAFTKAGIRADTDKVWKLQQKALERTRKESLIENSPERQNIAELKQSHANDIEQIRRNHLREIEDINTENENKLRRTIDSYEQTREQEMLQESQQESKTQEILRKIYNAVHPFYLRFAPEDLKSTLPTQVKEAAFVVSFAEQVQAENLGLQKELARNTADKNKKSLFAQSMSTSLLSDLRNSQSAMNSFEESRCRLRDSFNK